MDYQFVIRKYEIQKHLQPPGGSIVNIGPPGLVPVNDAKQIQWSLS